jgi:hypothetical protein
MRRVILPPLIIVVAGAVAVAVAFILDAEGSAQRDAALLVGTAGLWVLAVGTLWLIVALGYLAYQRRSPRS